MQHRTVKDISGTIVIFDTEYTTWEGAKERMWGGPNEYRELVQIAAQKIDVDTESVLDEFSRFVKPRINSDLSPYFTELTHITQEQLDESGEDFVPVYTDFIQWCDGLTIYSYGSSKTTDGDILKENIDLYQLDLPYRASQHENLRPLFQEFGIDVTKYTSGQLFKAFELELGGHVHNAMHDVDSLVQSLFAARKQS